MRNLTEMLKQKNLKVTPQRLAIYAALYHTQKHPSAEMIYRQLEDDYPTMSLATVYKTLDALKKVDLIQELNIAEDSFRYDARTEPHVHLVCRHCHCVLDGDELSFYRMLEEEMENTHDFVVENTQIYCFGVCKACRERQEAGA